MPILMIVMAVFPEIIYWITVRLGVISPVNFVYLFIIAVLLIKSFMMTIEISMLENKVKDLVQQIAIDGKERSDDKEFLTENEQSEEKGEKNSYG